MSMELILENLAGWLAQLLEGPGLGYSHNKALVS